jgi:catechol 2,3-dioxygenase-like lactoylglutathione lyase family enzyme
MILNVRHTGLVVNDLQASLDFYTKNLGFTVKIQTNEDQIFIDTILGLHNSELTTVKLSLNDGVMIELLDFKSDTRKITDRQIFDAGPTHMAFTVDDLDKTHEMFSRDGIEFISEPRISPDGFAKVAFCSAPEGTYIELVELLSEPLIESK